MIVLQRRYRILHPPVSRLPRRCLVLRASPRNGTFERGEKLLFERDSTRIAILPGENEDLMSEWVEGRYSSK
jgi:hypothetical protein